MFERIWSYPLHHAVGAYLSCPEDIFVTARQTRLVCLCPTTGREKWSVPIRGPWGWLAATEQLVFYLNQHSLLLAIDRATGEQVWSRELSGVNGWLHALNATVVVGGWRSYTDIIAIDATSGQDRWGCPAKDIQLHSTRIHAESNSLMIADPTHGGLFRFLGLADGIEISRQHAPGEWTTEYSERLNSTVDRSAPSVITTGPNSFALVQGKTPDIEHVQVDARISSQNLQCDGHRIVFLDEENNVYCWNVVDRRCDKLDRIDHNRGAFLPFAFIDGVGHWMGSSTGTIHFYSTDGNQQNSQRVGKRVSTALSITGSILVCGTDSGEVLGLSIS